MGLRWEEGSSVLRAKLSEAAVPPSSTRWTHTCLLVGKQCNLLQGRDNLGSLLKEFCRTGFPRLPLLLLGHPEHHPEARWDVDPSRKGSTEGSAHQRCTQVNWATAMSFRIHLWLSTADLMAQGSLTFFSFLFLIETLSSAQG